MMTSERSGLRIVAILTLLMGLAWYGLGYKVGVSNVRANDEWANSLRRAPVITAASQLDDTLVGRRVLVRGTIASDNPATEFVGVDDMRRQFVIYSSTRLHQGTPDSAGVTNSSAVPEKTVTPPVAVQISGGTARVTNSGYRMEGQSGAFVKPEPDLYVSGFAVGAEILIDGTVNQSGAAFIIEATTVSSGSIDTYVSAHSDQRGRAIYILTGQLLAGIGTLCVVVAAILGTIAALSAQRARREFADELARVARRSSR